ncbi:YqbF domain-containing protein [Bacillus sp. DX4.1]|uniref:YqbF domain-containing protein n=1 Tax=Bacillus sp. DX4.1 TaxID=3055867 RepID=UPI0025A2BE95|nr:YqbF domain-containing protein [Bacillus sp. DX4.1]MDM5190480.1 YqbF domain-containing protein [Bacillus sp. DX4.1]
MYYVKLIKGQSFYAFDHRFLLHQEEQVTQKIFKYLCKNEFFELRKDESSPIIKKEQGK